MTPDDAEHSATSVGPSDRELLTQFVSERDVPCPLCQYNLRGLISPMCPECGRALQLTVGLVEPPLKAWLWLMVPLGMSGGVGVLFLIASLAQGEMPPSQHVLFYVGFIGAVLTIPMAVITLATRRRFMRLATSNQIAIAIIGVLIVLMVFGSFTISVIMDS